jgi:hypothetical protein
MSLTEALLLLLLQIKQLFAFCGSVTDVTFVGNNSQFAFVEYATAAVSLYPYGA